MQILKWLGGLLLVLAAGGTGFVIFLLLTAPDPASIEGPTEGWFLAESMPSPRGELATAVAHASPCQDPPCPELERLHVVGGLRGFLHVLDLVHVYDPVQGGWSDGPPLPRPRHHLAAAGLGEAVYVSGGAEGVGRPWTPESDLWRLELGRDAWESLEAMPEPRWGHRMVAHDGRLFVVGGEGPSSSILIYTPGSGWTTGAEMPEPRDHLSVVVADDRIWAMGGRVPESRSRVDIYDPVEDEWRPGPELPVPTSGAAEGVVDGVIFISGGEEMQLLRGGIVDQHWALHTGASSPAPSSATSPAWEPVVAPPIPVHGADGAIFQGTFVIAGGASRHGALSVTAWSDAFQWMDR